MRPLSVLSAAILALATAASGQQAKQSPVVVELFTSQGCSSCPPADALLHELAARDDVIALALHVDYWDYIGWKDPFARPGNTKRQRAYAAEGGRRSVYTPEMIIDGESDIVGTKPAKVLAAIEKHRMDPAMVSLDLQRSGDMLTVTATPLGDMSVPCIIQLVRYTPERTTRIERGENAGKTFSYANIVEDWQVLGKWDGTAPITFTVKVEGDAPVVVLVQESELGPIHAAARLR